MGKPGRLESLSDGRFLNLRCAGRGAPTVLLESGFGAGSEAWFKVQPTLAATTRTCAYDRAGYGFSDPGPLPRDGAAIARDIDEGLQHAGLSGPFIVVGHSAGGLYARLFAARRRLDVVGLVFLDTTIEQLAPLGRPDADGLGGIRQRLKRCFAATETQPTPPLGDPRWIGCVPRAADAQALRVAQRSDTWRGQLSELDSIFSRTSLEVGRVGDLLTNIPAYVITASDTAAAASRIGVDQPRSVWELQHQQLAASFQRSSQRTVLSSHLVMIDRPDVVIAAVLEMVKATRKGRPPEPLGASEWTLEAATQPSLGGPPPPVPQAPPGQIH